jgi:gentisate 1,2-dioxygenase
MSEHMPRTIADLPAQFAEAPKSDAEARARYFNSGNAFNVKLSPIPGDSFVAEPARALDPDTPTSLIDCDRSCELGCPFPATTPLVLARYARIRREETLAANFAASGVVMYVMQGKGVTRSGEECVQWREGDLLVLPGGVPQEHTATEADAVLWIVTNEPQLAFECVRPPAPGEAPTDVVHFTAEEMERQIDLIYRIGRSNEIAGSALILSSERQEASRNVLPTLTVAMNSLPPGKSQRPHRHNSVAVALIIQGDDCHSTVDGRRKDWAQWATTVTPATAAHSHTNNGNMRAMFLIVQDGGIYYHTRAMGFAFVGE